MLRQDLLFTETLPPLPYVAHQIMLAVNEQEPNTGDIASLLAKEPGLCARIIAMANSVFFRHRNPIYAIDEAIARLGLNRVRVLVASLLLANQFDASRCRPFRPARYWQHALVSAFAAMRLSRHVPVEEGSEAAYLGGLLHNIGLLLLVHALPEEMASVLRLAGQRPELSLRVLCQSRIGCDQYEAGALLLREWNLPAPLVQVAAHCREPDYKGPYARLVSVVRVCIDWSRSGLSELPERRVLPEVPHAQLEAIAREVQKEQEQLLAFARLLAAA